VLWLKDLIIDERGSRGQRAEHRNFCKKNPAARRQQGHEVGLNKHEQNTTTGERDFQLRDE
jgi:hypothetical protein